MTAARRLAAILAVDVVGYSRLMGEDEAGTARAVSEHREAARPMIAGLGGRIVKTTGDGLLLEFPSVVAAVECAIAIQKLMAERNAGTPEAKRILYRIGVNLGDVLIEGDDILGDGVNIAARLEGICEPGGIFLSGGAFDHVRGRVDADFVDLGEMALKNIARPVRVHAIRPAGDSAASAPSAATPNDQGLPSLSIVVLPFSNMSGEPEQEHFVDGVTDSLTTDLSRISGSFVIGRNTAFTYKGRHVDLKQIGRELNVRYILEGSVQRAGSRMRVNVQLIDAETGKHLWAERFDKPIADLFDMQDEIVARLANALGPQLFAAEARRAEQKPKPDSMDLCFQGWAWRNKGITADNLARSRRLFEQAAALDPANVFAPIGLASADIQIALTFLTDDRIARLAVAEDNLTAALSMAPESALPICSWASSRCIRIAPLRASRRASGRWISIETWPSRTRRSATASFSSASPRRPSVTSRRRCGLVPATPMSISGACSPGWPKCYLAGKRRRSFGCAGQSTPTGITRAPGSFSPPLWLGSDGFRRRDPSSARDWPRLPVSPLPDFARA
jgi:TolB-like protein/class 3 adenylate cyclase